MASEVLAQVEGALQSELLGCAAWIDKILNLEQSSLMRITGEWKVLPGKHYYKSQTLFIINSASVSCTKSTGRLTLFAAHANVSQKSPCMHVIFKNCPIHLSQLDSCLWEIDGVAIKTSCKHVHIIRIRNRQNQLTSSSGNAEKDLAVVIFFITLERNKTLLQKLFCSVAF